MQLINFARTWQATIVGIWQHRQHCEHQHQLILTHSPSPTSSGGSDQRISDLLILEEHRVVFFVIELILIIQILKETINIMQILTT
jgi:hypothetical protein